MKSFFLIKLKIKKLYKNSKIELYLRNLKVMFDFQKNLRENAREGK